MPSCHLVVIKRSCLRYSIRDRYSNRGCTRLVRALKRSWRVWRASSLSGKVVGLRGSFLNAACGVTRWLVRSASAPNRFPLLLLPLFFFFAERIFARPSRRASPNLRRGDLGISTPAICSCKSQRNFHKVRKFDGRRGTYRVRLNYRLGIMNIKPM